MILDELVKQYKQNKKKEQLDLIYKELLPTLKNKAEYVFYQKKFNIKNRTFRLCDLHKYELEDILQELYLEILRLINNYDPTKPFSNYLYSTLWDWQPAFLHQTQATWQDINTVSATNLETNEGEPSFMLENLAAVEPEIYQNLNPLEMFKKLTKAEERLLFLILKHPHKNQTELAKILRVTQQNVADLLGKIRKKYKSNL